MGLIFIFGDNMYEYVLNAASKYDDWMTTSIFSTELLSKKEFEEVVKKAYEATYNEKFQEYGDWNEVANKIVENDSRFFFPKKGHVAIIKYYENNNFQGVY